jgi:Intracellular septation protein A
MIKINYAISSTIVQNNYGSFAHVDPREKSSNGPLLSGILITLFGGLTIYFDDPIFIYMKPTIINILFGLALMFGKYFTKEPVLKKILGKSMPLSDEGWRILNNRWTYFFFALAILNEIIWRTQSEEFWVNFKVWGMLPITFIFTAFQIGLINKHKLNE